MKRASILFLMLVPMIAGLASCGGTTSATPGASAAEHVHDWCPWIRDVDAHWRYCKTCHQDEYGEHEDRVCETCADFHVLALGFIEGGDGAHADFAKECNEYFPQLGKEEGFTYDFSSDFEKLNDENLAHYEAVMFLNNYPYSQAERQAFERYMDRGGGWIGYHVSAFTMENKTWDWYFNSFLGSGDFRTNTWNPTKELLKVESHNHPAVAHVPDTFMSSPNEWYGWSNDLRENEDIEILLSLDDSTFPVGDRQGEIWYNESGEDYFPVAWANRNYNMVYMNMGHNLMPYNDFEKHSKTFTEEHMNRFVLDALKSVALPEE